MAESFGGLIHHLFPLGPSSGIKAPFFTVKWKSNEKTGLTRRKAYCEKSIEK